MTADCKMAKRLLIVVSFSLLAGCNAPRTPVPPPPPPSPGHEGDRLTNGPRSPGLHGPLSAADFDRDGTVTRAEIESFMQASPYRRIGLLAFFDQHDNDGDKRLSDSEFAAVAPPHAFDGTDANADDVVTRDEVESYVADKLYRRIGLEAFFELIDTDHNVEISPAEVETAHQTGQLSRD